MLYDVRDLAHRIDEVIERCNLAALRDTKCGLLSSGEQTRAGLAKAMLNRPLLLLLDEPTASLDPAVARDMRAMIRRAVAETRSGVLWTSHNMGEVEEVCDRVLILSAGRIRLEGDPRTLPQQHGMPSLEELFVELARS
jgi:ABC-2 type transport system ATP-binding protein